MSKRHKKTKLIFSSLSEGPLDPLVYGYDLDVLDAPRGKRPKGKHRRSTHKSAYYD